MVSAREKIASRHLERLAIVYLRQSSPRQVRENFRSTERQYATSRTINRSGWRLGAVFGALHGPFSVTVDGLVIGPGEDGFECKQRHGRAP